MKPVNNLALDTLKSSPDSSKKTKDDFSPFDGGKGDGSDQESASEMRSAKNKVEEFIERNSFRLSDLELKENREKPRYRDKEQSAIEQTNSNRIPKLSGKS